MAIGNMNQDSFEMACILCGVQERLTLTAHRNNDEHVTGWVAACAKCQEQLATCHYQVYTDGCPQTRAV